jgi:hypothetical protein
MASGKNSKSRAPQAESVSESFPAALQPDQVTLLGYGALLSESSSRLTFPELQNFRHVRIPKMRRVFAHPHLFLIGQNIADPTKTLRLASLSAEPCGDEECSFVAAAFTVKLDDTQRANFVARESGYDIVSVPYCNLEGDGNQEPGGYGVICIASSDQKLNVSLPDNLPVQSIWHWPLDSGIRPADVYLRHCLLAVKKAGGSAEESFLHDTFLVDRKTTLAEYLSVHRDDVMASRPPPELATRFGG